MKIATWNVNGIRAREAQVREWLARDRPDAVCLQEIKAKPEQIPELLFESEGYWCYWHGAGGYSGVALHLRKELCAERPAFAAPRVRPRDAHRHGRHRRPTIASVYVPNGGKDYAAKLRFLEALGTPGRATCGRRAPARHRGRSQRRAHRPRRAPEGAQARRRRPAGGRARAPARTDRPGPRGRRPRAGPRQRRPLHLVGALAEPAAAQHRLADRLPPGERGAGETARAVRRAGGGRHERPRPGRDLRFDGRRRRCARCPRTGDRLFR